MENTCCVTPVCTSNAEVHISKSTNAKTLKKKKKLSDLEKNRLWNIYDQEKQSKPSITIHSPENEQTDQLQIETDFCHKCKNILQFNEEGFPSCINPNCGYMDNSAIDYSPEWRYFAQDQKQEVLIQPDVGIRLTLF